MAQPGAWKYGKLPAQTRDDWAFHFILGRQRSRRAAIRWSATQAEYILDRDRQALRSTQIRPDLESCISRLCLRAGRWSQPQLVCIQCIAVASMTLLSFVE